MVISWRGMDRSLEESDLAQEELYLKERMIASIKELGHVEGVTP